jgi:hypothetical protein
MALLSHIVATDIVEVIPFPSALTAQSGSVGYNCSMTEALQDVFAAIRELPDDVQDAIADQLIQVMDLASLHED